MPKKAASGSSVIYQLKVTLTGSQPPIWRRIQVESDTRLPRLHTMLQTVMGWSDYHLHQFNLGDVYYGVPAAEYDEDMEDEKRVKLDQIAVRTGDKFLYEYDFGDSWEHLILLEKILPREAGVHYPVCLTGKRACPPEDCGGVWGYAEFLEAIANPEHPEHEEMLEWCGGGFDPEAFDLNRVNATLQRIK